MFFAVISLMLAGKCFATPVTVQPFVTPNDVTIPHLETFRTVAINAINSADGGNIQTGTITSSKLDDNSNPTKRWDEAFNDWVFTGIVPATSASLTSDISAGTAYIAGYRVVKDTYSKTYGANTWTYVDLSSNGTYTFTETGIGTGEPAVSTGAMRIGRVSSDSTTINHVRDDRMLTINLGGGQESYQRTEMTIGVVTPANVTITSGIVYQGTTRLAKTTSTSLDLATASDWATGITARATSTYGYVVINSSGLLKLTTTTPGKTDVGGNANGALRYSVISGAYWRCLGWFYMNAAGSGNIDTWGFANFPDGMSNKVVRKYGDRQTSSSAIPLDNTIPQITEGAEFMSVSFKPSSVSSKIRIRVVAYCQDNVTRGTTIALFDGSTNAIAVGHALLYDAYPLPLTVNYEYVAGTTSPITFSVRIGDDSGNAITMNGVGSTAYFNNKFASFIEVEETL